MNFALADDDLQLAEVVDKLLTDGSFLEAARDDATRQRSGDELWSTLVELGIAALVLDQDHGGSGGTMMQARLVAGALGRHLASPAFVWSSILPAVVVAQATPGSVRDQLLAALVDGGSPIVPGFTNGGASLATVVASWSRSDTTAGAGPLSVLVPHGTQAGTALLVDAASRDGATLRIPVVELGGASVVTRQPRSDLQELAHVEVAAVSDLAVLEVDAAVAARGIAALKLGLSALAAGALDRVSTIAAEYAATREQFGKPIGSFQAVAHRCVDMRARADGDLALCDLLAWTLDQGGEPPTRLAALTKARATRDFVEGATGALHVYAGHGFSLESDVQLFYRFARGLEATWGTPDTEYASAPRADGRGDVADMTW